MTTIDVLARRIGELRAVELAVFETLGAWALDAESDPADRVAFAACAHRAAWRDEQLVARAPALTALPPGAALTLGDDDLGRAVAALDAQPAAGRMDAARTLGALLATAYTDALTTVEPTDAPSRRLFQRLAHDVALPE